MTAIEESKLLDLMNAFLIKQPNYVDVSIKITGVSIDSITRELTIYADVTEEQIFLAQEYIEQIEPHFRGKYDRII